MRGLFLTLMLATNFLSFAQTEQEALQKIDELNSIINIAQNQGIDTSKELMTIEVAELFLGFANWDENNIATNQTHFETIMPLPLAEQGLYTPSELANYLPTYERQCVIELLDESMVYLNTLISGENIRKQTTTIDWSALEVQGNKIMQNGKPVFLNDWIWGPNGLSGAYFAPNNLEQRSDGSGKLKQWPKDQLNEKANSGILGTPFLGHTSVPGYISNNHPDILNAQTTFTKYDIDHPKAREMLSDLLTQVATIFQGKKAAELGYMIANEPHWNTAEGTWDVIIPSEYSKQNFVNWLASKHENNINNLQAAWSSNPSSFQQAVDNFIFPVPYALQGEGEWYDWMKFNQERVTEYFIFMKDQIRTKDPNSKVHIKLIPGMWSGNKRDHGLDFEALTNISQVIGNDAGGINSYLWGSTKWWEENYAFDWSAVSMPYDFLSSVKPNAVNYNSETHFLSKASFRDIFLEPSYARMTHWLATLHGMNVSTNWFWGRNSDGSPKGNGGSGYPGSVLQQPKIYHEILSTMIDLNAHSEAIDALQHIRKPVRLFYSETSAINSLAYMENVFDTYESIYFDGYAIGFVTENILQTQSSSQWDVVVIANAETVKSSEITALQNYLNNGGTVIIDNASLLKDEYGNLHSQILNANTGTLITTTTNNIKTEVDNFLNTKNIIQPVKITETNPLGANVKGCVHRSVDINEKTVVNLVNITKEPINIHLELTNGVTNIEAINLLNGKTVSIPFTMQPEEVLLLEIIDLSCIDKDLITPCSLGDELYVNVKLFLEGFVLSDGKMNDELNSNNLLPLNQPFNNVSHSYSGTERVNAFNSKVVDWVLVKIHDNTGNVLDQKPFLLHRGGNVKDFDNSLDLGFILPSGSNYKYLSVHHKSHLDVIADISSSTIIDFSQSQTGVALGNGQTTTTFNKNAIIAGDFDGNGIINNLDYNVWEQNNSAVYYYLNQDADGNGIVNNLDYNLWDINKSKVGNQMIQN